MFDSKTTNQTFSASEIVSNPEKLLSMQKYAILSDASVRGSYKSLIEAMNLMASAGWR